MKTSWRTTMTAVFLLLCTIGIQAQETVAASGGEAAGNGGTVSYTAGQVAYTATTSGSETMEQGVQQTYDIFVAINNEEIMGIKLEIMVYPNPTSDYLKLVVEDYQLENLVYLLYDLNGKLLQKGDISFEETVIQTGYLLPAEYYMKVRSSQKELKAFIIVKY